MSNAYDPQQEASRLQRPVAEARALAERLGLEPTPINYWIVDHDEMNQLIAYGGFQERYPHWRWGMKYDKQRKQDQYLGGKAFEIVNNDSPAHAFLQQSNTLADQKAVITHVEAHADFFANNEWFGMFPDGDSGATAMLSQHANRIRSIMDRPDVDRDRVERWIDNILSLADTIDQHRSFSRELNREEPDTDSDIAKQLDQLDLDDEVRETVFDDEWLESQQSEDDELDTVAPESDVLAFLREYGKQYDESNDRAVEFEDWQQEIIEILRTEAYYFAAQRMTKVLNEGWASYWESIMMAGENFAAGDEFVTYADHMSQVLGAPGLNPYKLGYELWQYVENQANRREVLEHLLRVKGITWRNLKDAVDFDAVLEQLEPPEPLVTVDLDTIKQLPDQYVDQDALTQAREGNIDVDTYPWKVLTYEGLAHRHYSLTKPQNRQFLSNCKQDELERIGRYLFDVDRYDSVEEAIADVDVAAGWDRMREVRASHNDVTFLDEYLTPEFVEANDYFTYEHSRASEGPRVASVDPMDVKRKLLLQFTNFGKPTIIAEDGNYNNRNELLLAHKYNGIMLDIDQARRVLERAFELWGRPVHLKTIIKEVSDHDLEVARRRNREPEPEESGLLITYDGDAFTDRELDWSEVEHLAADDIDYDTRPDEWL